MGQRGNGLGNTNGAGRKSKAEELGMFIEINECINKAQRQKIWRKLAERAEKGSHAHAQLLLSYIYGKPAEKYHITSDQRETPIDLDQLSESAMLELVKSTEGIILDEDTGANGRGH